MSIKVGDIVRVKEGRAWATGKVYMIERDHPVLGPIVYVSGAHGLIFAEKIENVEKIEK